MTKFKDILATLGLLGAVIFGWLVSFAIPFILLYIAVLVVKAAWG